MSNTLANKKIEIYQEFADGKISKRELEDQIFALEKAANLDMKEVKAVFKKIEEACPDLKDDLEDMLEDIEEACKDNGGGDDDDKGDDEVVEESVSYEALLADLGCF